MPNSPYSERNVQPKAAAVILPRRALPRHEASKTLMARERNHTNKTTFRGLKQPRVWQRRNENHIDRKRNFAGLKRNQDFHDARKKTLAKRRGEFHCTTTKSQRKDARFSRLAARQLNRNEKTRDSRDSRHDN